MILIIKTIIAFLFFYMGAFISLSQNIDSSNCVRNSGVPQYLKRIPPEICLPRGYSFEYLYESTDMNNDKLKDLIIRWSKNPLKDGDTTFISIYLQTMSGKYVKFKTFNNLFPIFFNSYSYSYKIADKKLDELQGRYNGFPLRNLFFKNGEIILEFETEKDINVINKYTYDLRRKNWYLINQKEINVGGAENVILRNEKPKNEQTIDQFNYFDYL